MIHLAAGRDNASQANEIPAIPIPKTEHPESPNGPAIGLLESALRLLQVASPRDQAICITVPDILNISLSGSIHSRVKKLREEILKRKEELFDGLQMKTPATALNVLNLVAYPTVYRECNNYLLTPDPGSVQIVAGSITKFSYKGKEYFPAERAFRVLTEKGEICIHPGTETNCDNARFSHNTITFADGCNLGRKSLMAAQHAVDVAHKVICELLVKRPPSTFRDIVCYHLGGFDAAQAKLKACEHETSETTLRVTSVYGGYVFSASLGDTLLLVSRREQNNFFCIDPSEQQLCEVDSETDCGGCLGSNAASAISKGRSLTGPDLRSFSVSIMKLKPGDMLHVLSDGTYACFDPLYLGLKPRDVDPNIRDESWDEKKTSHQLLRKQYIRSAFAKEINDCQTLGDVVKRLNAYTEQATAAHKLALLCGITPIPPGKVDHANSVHMLI